MALSAYTIFEVRQDGNDTNGGAFDPSRSAGMPTNGAATDADTASPVFTSATYNFVAGDVGAFVYIAAGTSWTPGWYEIASVAANAATLKAAVGEAVLSTGSTTATIIGPNTVVGAATVASPTGATWAIDYSQQAGAQFTYTDLASAGAGLAVSSATTPFKNYMCGNSIKIASGTNFTAGVYVISSVNVSDVATVLGVGNITTGAGASGVGSTGGAFASVALPGAYMVASNDIYIKYSATPYTVSSASTNIANGCLSLTANGATTNKSHIVGYNAGRYPNNADTSQPKLQASGAISSFTMISTTAVHYEVNNIHCDGADYSSSTGISTTGLYSGIHRCRGTNCAVGINAGAGSVGGVCLSSYAESCVVGIRSAGMLLISCEAKSCSTAGFEPTTTSSGGAAINCIAWNNTGDGFSATGGYGIAAINCVAYNNTGDGFAVGTLRNFFLNCIAQDNGAEGFSFAANNQSNILTNCAGYNNTSGNYSTTNVRACSVANFVTGTASFFTNAAAGDFSLNTTAGGGAAARSAGFQGYLTGLTTGYIDIGAAQHADPVGGGGGGPLVHGRLAA